MPAHDNRPADYPLSDASRAFLDRMQRDAPEPPARAEVAGLAFEFVETATRWDGCPNCERLKSDLEHANEIIEMLERANGDT